MSYINESCGCDGKGNSYDSIINASPLLSGSQESAFSPQTDNFSFLDTLNVNDNSSNNKILNENSTNNFSQNDDSKDNYSLDDLISMSNQNNSNANNENKFSDNNIYSMNQNNSHFNLNENQNPNLNLNMQNNVGMNNNIPMQNNIQMQNNMPTNNQIPDPGMMRQNMPSHVNPELQVLMNKINLSNASSKNNNKNEQSQDDESVGRFILKNFNIVLIVIIGLAWSDVVKFYINRSIKFGNGNHRYYVYYAVIASVVLYGTSKYIHYLK